METQYRGFDIDVTKEKSMAGYKLTYFSIFRQSDGYEVVSGFSDDDDTVQTWVEMMKSRVDGFILDPSEEVLKDSFTSDEDYALELARHREENVKTASL
jgi:hypothetical protein